MNITPDELYAQVERFTAEFPLVWVIESEYRLPRGLLLAVGSRETNLTNEIGDNGHGHGVWQLDDRSHIISSTFDDDVSLQAHVAGIMLSAALAQYGWIVDRAACVYNSGQPLDQYTTGGDYGLDVFDRMVYIQMNFPASQSPSSTPSPSRSYNMLAYDPVSGGTWAIRPNGAVYAADGAPYLGGLNNHPQYNAGGNGDPAVGISFYGSPGSSVDDKGYEILCDNGISPEPARYRFPYNASLAK